MSEFDEVVAASVFPKPEEMVITKNENEYPVPGLVVPEMKDLPEGGDYRQEAEVLTQDDVHYFQIKLVFDSGHELSMLFKFDLSTVILLTAVVNAGSWRMFETLPPIVPDFGAPPLPGQEDVDPEAKVNFNELPLTTQMVRKTLEFTNLFTLAAQDGTAPGFKCSCVNCKSKKELQSKVDEARDEFMKGMNEDAAEA